MNTITERNVYLEEKNKIIIENLTVIAVFISVISQIPAVYKSSLLSMASAVIWFVLLAVLLYNNAKIVLHPILILPVMFDLWLLICELTHGFSMKYLHANLVRPVNMCTFIIELGFMLSRFYSPEFLKKIAKAYVCATTILSVVIYFDYFAGRQITGDYLYGGKNSAASIVLCSLIFLFAMKKEVVPKQNKLLWLSAIVFHVIILFYMQSRAVLVSGIVVLLWYLLFIEKRWYVKLIIIIACTGVVMYVWNDPELYDLFVNKMLLNEKDVMDINAVTSNRLDHFEAFKELFPPVIVMGQGGTYLESFPLAALLSFGVVGAGVLFIYMLYPLVVGISLVCKKRRTMLGLLIILVSVSLLINCLAEEQPPYGPGVKCFLMWFLAGFALRSEKNEEGHRRCF